jgi:hypothetical protein
MSSEPSVNPHPVTYFVTPQLEGRNRLTTFFRFILAVPHALIAGGPGASASVFGYGPTGALGAAAAACAFISWFAIVFTGRQPRGLWDLAAYHLRWRSKAVAYAALLRDEYPPFGEGDYPAAFGLGELPETRNRWSVGLRVFLLIPQAVVLFFIGIAWVITAVIGWFAILFTGSYPEGLYRFGIGYLRWSLRVEAYALLMHDEYPPFSLD